LGDVAILHFNLEYLIEVEQQRQVQQGNLQFPAAELELQQQVYLQQQPSCRIAAGQVSLLQVYLPLLLLQVQIIQVTLPGFT
jgi:hypothetical protein